MVSRREFLTGGAAAGVVKALEVVGASAAEQRAVLPANWPDHHWIWTRSGQEGDSDKLEPQPLPTDAGNFIVVHTGDVDYTDTSGYKVSYRSGETGGSITVVQGPSGKEKGGTDVWLAFRKRWSSVKVAQDLSGGNLNAAETARVINTQLKSFRDNRVNGRVFVLVIDGQSGNVKEERFIPPGQWVVED